MRNDNRGFSLVEILIVVAVMSVILSIVGALYTQYVKRSKIHADVASAETILNAVDTAVKEKDVIKEIRTKIGAAGGGPGVGNIKLYANAGNKGDFRLTKDGALDPNSLFESSVNQYMGDGSPEFKYLGNNAAYWVVTVDYDMNITVAASDSSGTELNITPSSVAVAPYDKYQ